jgi:hypothetical protein
MLFRELGKKVTATEKVTYRRTGWQRAHPTFVNKRSKNFVDCLNRVCSRFYNRRVRQGERVKD